MMAGTMIMMVMFVSMLSHFALRTSHFFEMDIKLHAGDAGFLFMGDVEVAAVELQFLQLALQLDRIRAEVNQRADKHVAADAAENVEIKRFHFKFISATDETQMDTDS